MKKEQTFSEWEGDVIHALSMNVDMTYSDATGVVMARQSMVEECWDSGVSAEETAKKIEQIAFNSK